MDWVIQKKHRYSSRECKALQIRLTHGQLGTWLSSVVSSDSRSSTRVWSGSISHMCNKKNIAAESSRSSSLSNTCLDPQKNINCHCNGSQRSPPWRIGDNAWGRALAAERSTALMSLRLYCINNWFSHSMSSGSYCKIESLKVLPIRS